MALRWTWSWSENTRSRTLTAGNSRELHNLCRLDVAPSLHTAGEERLLLGYLARRAGAGSKADPANLGFYMKVRKEGSTCDHFV